MLKCYPNEGIHINPQQQLVISWWLSELGDYPQADSTFLHALHLRKGGPKPKGDCCNGSAMGTAPGEGRDSLHTSLWQPRCLQRADTMPKTGMDTHCLELMGGWKIRFNEEPSSQTIPVITQCTVKFCTSHTVLTNHRSWWNGIFPLMCLHISVIRVILSSVLNYLY